MSRFSPVVRVLVSYVRVSGVFGDEWYVADMGFRGDRIENVLWRVIEGELLGYEPDRVVLSVGRHNCGVNTDAEIKAGLDKLESYVRAAVPIRFAASPSAIG